MCSCTADGTAAIVTLPKTKGKPRGRPFKSKATPISSMADQNVSPQRVSVCASTEVVYEAVPVDDFVPGGLLVDVVVAKP